MPDDPADIMQAASSEIIICSHSVLHRRYQDIIIFTHGPHLSFGPTLNDTACSIESPCDCCASDILFSDEHHFIAIFWCLQDNTYAHGTYSIEGGQVYLQFEGKKVDYLSDMQLYYDSLAQHDSLQSISRYVVDTMPHNIDTLRGFICHDKLLFKSRSMDYGGADREIHNKSSGFIQDTILRMMELQ
ncbi:MAG: hypothetical protein JST90_07720 [Bacteroidetes bacterium]|nr:hypothetical protein [Bacteroidota bacterium]